jgi:pyruvate,water dikinase
MYIKELSEVGIEDVAEVGGKNASLGEMITELSKKGIPVPGGYAVTATAYQAFIKHTDLIDYIHTQLDKLNTKDLDKLAQAGKAIREKFIETPFPKDVEEAIRKAHEHAEKRYGKNADFAVRSSATAEDLPGASFAGEHETYLNITGIEDTLLAIRKAMASLFNDRAISYRVDKGFDHFKVSLSVGVQKMIRSDKSCSGVMFSLDTETGFSKVVLINGVYGLGEMIVQGQVTPDEFIVFKETLNKKTPHHKLNLIHNKTYKPLISKKIGTKLKKMVYGEGTHPTKIVDTTESERNTFVLTDDEVLKLASWGVEIEKHYTERAKKWTPMDMEWAKDGTTGELFIVQARPETIHAERDLSKIKTYTLTDSGKELVRGASVGNRIATGKARVILTPEGIKEFKAGEILVTEMTDPDWEPIMKIASAIITDKGGRTSHAAIVSRELGIPCIVGSEVASHTLKTGQDITVDTTGTEGIVYEGTLKYKVDESNIGDIPETKTHVMMNIATPETAFEKSFLPNKGVGLAREEFIIASGIGIHPNALVNYDKLPADLKKKIDEKTKGYEGKEGSSSSKTQFYVDNLASGIAKISASFYPNPVIVRLSDFKTNEYRTLLGGELYEPEEENPMIGWRGASRYYHPEFIEAFKLEVKAFKKVREEFGLTNTVVMLPFCRTVEEGKKVVEIMEKNGLDRKKDSSLLIYMMCEIPANVILADEFLDIFDGMSIGSNDLTQLTLGIDRDGNERIRSIANENNPAVKALVSQVIKKCKARGKYIGLCGQAPSDYEDFAAFLVKEGISSMSLNPDSVISTIKRIHKEEQKL